jgi:hypothetical protein
MAHTNATSSLKYRTNFNEKRKIIQRRNRSVIETKFRPDSFLWIYLHDCAFVPEICHIITSMLYTVPVLLLNLFYSKHIR